MRIILNSDVLHTKRPLATGLPDHLDRFCRDAATAGAVLVLPRTTLLEIERHQQQLASRTGFWAEIEFILGKEFGSRGFSSTISEYKSKDSGFH